MKQEELFSRLLEERRTTLELTPLTGACIDLPEDIIDILSRLSNEAQIKIEIKALKISSPFETDLENFKNWAVSRVGLCYKYTTKQEGGKSHDREDVSDSQDDENVSESLEHYYEQFKKKREGPTPPEERKYITMWDESKVITDEEWEKLDEMVAAKEQDFQAPLRPEVEELSEKIKKLDLPRNQWTLKNPDCECKEDYQNSVRKQKEPIVQYEGIHKVVLSEGQMPEPIVENRDDIVGERLEREYQKREKIRELMFGDSEEIVAKEQDSQDPPYEPKTTKAQFERREQFSSFRKMMEAIEKNIDDVQSDSEMTENDSKSTDFQDPDLLPGEHILD